MLQMGYILKYMRNIKQIALALNKGIFPPFLYCLIFLPYIKSIALLTILEKLFMDKGSITW